MQLTALIDGLALQVVSGDPSARVVDLVDDSRQVTPGSAFVLRPAAGQPQSLPRAQAHINDALSRGATTVIDVHMESLAPPLNRLDAVAWVQAVPGRADQTLTAQLADRFFGSPSTELILIGVTGTNGKTTIAFIVKHLMTDLGFKTGMIGTVFTDVGASDGPKASALTTPGAIEVHRTLRDMRRHGCQACVMEVSSHALDQGRADALAFNAALFTNLTGDHLDYHHDMAAYAKAKARLFEPLTSESVAVINLDDAHWLEMVPPGGRVVYTTLKAVEHDLSPIAQATIHQTTARGSDVVLEGPWGTIALTLPLVGSHNVSNALQAVAAVYAVTDCESQQLEQSLKTCPAVPGRLEPVNRPDGRGPAVWVDYAHTHDALKNVLRAIKPLTQGQLILVFGCGGDRDRTKRPKMAQVAQQWADVIYLTSDNPRTEDPCAILQDMVAGLSGPTDTAIVEPDRAAAIARAIHRAKPDDAVLIAGKGHENDQIIASASGGMMKIHFDDRQQATHALEQWRKEAPTRCEPLT